mmetsp:Transcript_3044/g.2527  ORF Transcript_3044/g.2527 Transcript_3044/m.2527 type:complete len:156 (-) Transcript_3044:305-772(-)
MVDGMIEKLQRSKEEKFDLINTLKELSEGYSALGSEKLKILESSFDTFLEGILIGNDFKTLFYAADKEIPQTFAECQSYLKLKKFQRFEKYPDEKLREFLDIKLPMFKSNNEYNNFILNKMEIMKSLKKELIQGLQKLFEGKEMVYKALMRQEIS